MTSGTTIKPSTSTAQETNTATGPYGDGVWDGMLPPRSKTRFLDPAGTMVRKLWPTLEIEDEVALQKAKKKKSGKEKEN